MLFEITEYIRQPMGFFRPAHQMQVVAHDDSSIYSKTLVVDAVSKRVSENSSVNRPCKHIYPMDNGTGKKVSRVLVPNIVSIT